MSTKSKIFYSRRRRIKLNGSSGKKGPKNSLSLSDHVLKVEHSFFLIYFSSKVLGSGK